MKFVIVFGKKSLIYLPKSGIFVKKKTFFGKNLEKFKFE